MKLLTAVLRPDTLDAVHDALDPNEARVLCAAPVVDDRYSRSLYRGLELRQPRARFRIEVVVLNDLAVSDTIDAISRAALVTSGEAALVVVTTLDDVVRLPRALPSAELSDESDDSTLLSRQTRG
jgi:nitrogen regulatory protein PII